MSEERIRKAVVEVFRAINALNRKMGIGWVSETNVIELNDVLNAFYAVGYAEGFAGLPASPPYPHLPQPSPQLWEGDNL